MIGPPPPVVPGSVREQLAALALAAAQATPGVLGVAGQQATTVGSEALRGVVAVAGPSGCYDIDLFLRADLVALHPLGERVRERVRAAIDRAGLLDHLGTLGVAFLEIGPESITQGQ